MNTWLNRGASGGPCGGLEEENTEQPKQSDHVGLTQANRPPRNPVRFTLSSIDSVESLQALQSCTRVQGAESRRWRSKPGLVHQPNSVYRHVPMAT